MSDSKLSDELKNWRRERPDEWKMGEFIMAVDKLVQERNELAAKVEQLQKIPYTKTRAEFMESWGVDGMSADKKRLANAAWDRAEWFFNQQAVALKAQWQAEAFSAFVSALENVKNEAECSEDTLVKTMVEFSIKVTERYLASNIQHTGDR